MSEAAAATKRKTMLIYATPQSPGKCGSCGAAITWAQTVACAYMPMNRGFEAIGREGATGSKLRVYRDQSHFSTCPNKRHRKGGGNVENS